MAEQYFYCIYHIFVYSFIHLGALRLFPDLGYFVNMIIINIAELESHASYNQNPFFLKVVLTIQDLLWFHTKFRIIRSSSVKYAIEILIRIILNLQIALGTMGLLTILIPPIHKHKLSFHYLCLLQFISSVSCSFKCTGLSHPW